MIPEWFRQLALMCLSTMLVTIMVCVIYGTVRITFMVLQDWQEERRQKRGRSKAYHDRG